MPYSCCVNILFSDCFRNSHIRFDFDQGDDEARPMQVNVDSREAKDTKGALAKTVHSCTWYGRFLVISIETIVLE